jgi:hypothetical protein
MDAQRQRRNSRARRARSTYRACLVTAALGAAVLSSPDARGEERSQQVSLGGQYRINAYSAQNDIEGKDDQTASRVRIRQNVDVRFDDRFKTHVQLELGHTTANVDTTAVRLGVRHAVLDYTADNGLNLQAGIVPVADRFGDTLFSSDWNYNPVAAVVTMPLGGVQIRAFAGTLLESGSDSVITGAAPSGEDVSGDDTTHYQVDVSMPVGKKVQLNAGGTYVRFGVLDVGGERRFRSRDHFNYGVGARVSLARDLALSAFLIGSQTDSAIIAAGNGDASGIAAKVELTGKAGRGKFGLLATHASGEDNGSGFIPVQAVAKTNGYWGYTGILTVQGPTDTGFDGDSVNISNNGFGMTSVQARYVMPVFGALSAYAAAGWFGNSNAAGRSGDVGMDFLLMATYRLNRVLALDLGGAVARIEDTASGYPNGVSGGFSQAAGTTRNKTAVIARMQAEF